MSDQDNDVVKVDIPAPPANLEQIVKDWFHEHVRMVELDLAAIHPWKHVEGKLKILVERLKGH